MSIDNTTKDVMKNCTRESPIKNFYVGKNVFITGATGALGSCIVEKLLRDIPEIGTLYLLMRAKDGQSVEQRFEIFKQNSVFQRWKITKLSKRFDKIQPIEGDVGVENLGLSPSNRQLLIHTVNVVIHAAATPLLCEGLRETTEVNVLGARRMVALCRQMTQLYSLVHVSSAYANAHLMTVEELLYPCDNAEKIIDLTTKFSDDILKTLEKELIKDHPNTYTYTRQLAEHEVAKASTHFPCGIVRPSIVTPAWQEPVTSWLHSETGLPGLIRDCSRGIIRRLPLNMSKIVDFIPVDVAANAIITMGHHLHELKVQNEGNPEELLIIHLTSGSYNPCRFEALSLQINKSMHEYPVTSAVWYPKIQMVDSLFWFRIGCIIYHFIPALFLDLCSLLTGNGKPRFIEYHIKRWKQVNALKKFLYTEWNFDNQIAMDVSNLMEPEDQQIFRMDVTDLKWTYYFFGLHMAVREHLNKESPKTLEMAKTKSKILYWINMIIRFTVYGFIYWSFMGIGFNWLQIMWILIFAIVLLDSF